MKEVLFWLVVIAVFGGIPLSLPFFIRRITENPSEKELRKETKRVGRIAWINEMRLHIAEMFRRIMLMLRPGEVENAHSSLEAKINSIFHRAKAIAKGGTSKIARCLDPKWGTSIILGAFLVFSIYEYTPPRIWKAGWDTGIFAPFYLIGLLELMGEPFQTIAKAIYCVLFAATIAGSAAIIYWLLFHKPAKR